MLNILLIVGYADDIFIFNYAKWLKKQVEDISIDVFEVYQSTQQGYDNRFYNCVTSAEGCVLPVPRGKSVVDAIARGRSLYRYLRGKHYDIIHSHWVVAPVVLQNNMKKYCEKFVLTFWGGEFIEQRVLGSSRLYRYLLNCLSKNVDCIINSSEGKQELLNKLPYFKGTYKCGYLGSAPLEALFDLLSTESKSESKKKWGMPEDKLTVMIGYSGKPLHRHIAIIKALRGYPELIKKIHLIVSMTRGATNDYIDRVENEMKRLGCSYTLFRGRFLSDIEMARIRNATDVVFQLSEWDGFSRSIVECLCAKSIMIYGDWLDYKKHMETYGFEGLVVPSIDAGVSKLAEVISNPSIYTGMLEKNCKCGRNKALWSECIKDWIFAYYSLLGRNN